MNPLDVSWSFLKDSEWGDWKRYLEAREQRKAAQAEREAAASKVTTDATGQDPDAAERTEREEPELSRKIREANEKTRQKLANQKPKEKFRRRRDDEPHIHWMTPNFENNPVGWLNGHGPYIDLHEHPNYPHGFYQTVSGHEEKGPLPWKHHEIVDGEVREKDLSGPVEGLPGMSFDANGNLVGDR